MIDHGTHRENARRALRYFDNAPNGAQVGKRGVMVAGAMRVLLYEPVDEFQGDFMPGGRYEDAFLTEVGLKN